MVRIDLEKEKKIGSCLFSYHSLNTMSTEYFGQVLMDYVLNKKKKIVAFFGELASGKTFLIKSMVRSLHQIDENLVSSPTFTYLNIYPTKPPIHHFDLYRLKGSEDFLTIFGHESLEESMVFIEWPNRIEPLLENQSLLRVYLSSLSENERLIEVFG